VPVPPARPVVASFSLLLTAAVLSTLGPTVDPATSATIEYESAVARYANTERATRKLTSVVRSDCLNRFADQQAQEMARSRQIGHQDLRPVLAACRLREVGENVAFGYPGGAAATAGWMASVRHRDNLLAPDHTEIGVGAHQDADGRWYVSEVMAAHIPTSSSGIGDPQTGKQALNAVRTGD
jgi:uncharacterized protein YkwD